MCGLRARFAISLLHSQVNLPAAVLWVCASVYGLCFWARRGPRFHRCPSSNFFPWARFRVSACAVLCWVFGYDGLRQVNSTSRLQREDRPSTCCCSFVFEVCFAPFSFHTLSAFVLLNSRLRGLSWSLRRLSLLLRSTLCFTGAFTCSLTRAICALFGCFRSSCWQCWRLCLGPIILRFSLGETV